MSSSVDYSDFDVAMSEALAHPEVVAYLDSVYDSLVFKWQLKIKPAYMRPAVEKHITTSYTSVKDGMFLDKAVIYVSPTGQVPLYASVLHELAHISQLIDGCTIKPFGSPFAEHDADARVDAISSFPMVATKSKKLTAGVLKNFKDASTDYKIRSFLYAQNDVRIRLLQVLSKDSDQIVVKFFASEWVSHKRDDVWIVENLNAADAAYKTWVKEYE